MAMNDFEIEIEGLDELDARMASFPADFNRECCRDGVEAMAVFLANQARDRAPVMTEAYGKRQPGELRDSIGVIMEPTSPDRPTSSSALVTPLYDGDGSQSPGVWGKFVEYGSVHNPEPQPFMRRTVDEDAEEAIDKCVAVVSERLDSFPGAPASSEAA